jgi:hypothetical protein
LSLLLQEEVVPDNILPGVTEVPLALHLLRLHSSQVGMNRRLLAIPDLFSPFLVATPLIKYGIVGEGLKTVRKDCSGKNECYEMLTWLAERYVPANELTIKHLGPAGPKVPLIFSGALQENKKSAIPRKVTGHMLYEFQDGKMVSLEEDFIFE